MRWIVVAALIAGCGGKLPETRYYQLAAPPARPAPTTDATVVVEPLETDAAYDDDRIVYRQSPYRLDYYDYHHWIAAPGTMVSDYLAEALAHSGRFRAIARDLSDSAAVVLGGRVIAIEEVDHPSGRWDGRVALELTLTDARTGEVLWSRQFDETEPIADRTPEGLAAALSRAMARVVAQVTPTIADTAQRQAMLHAQRKIPMANRTPAVVP
jgi:ABC-type uncharacterized transport system auxiliary subunit